ncbi:hypothetical protein [Enterococcus mundtii]|uniref:hypothetical protein n=1 Tax=Enterococcus TaxID=1350 RepID=UPI001884681F|nr:hypothetical protein [Enterococcus mundtii]MBE9910005.1 hypothetical protein [Enterococcus mundtii]MRI73606.1 hypothetical protein [Enterococcus mundtii]
MRFKWLKDYQELDEQILYLKWNLNKSKLELSRWIYGDLADVRIEKNSRSSMLEENIQKIENEIEILEEQRKEMLAIINSFKGIDNEIIRKKYVEGCSLELIAEEIGYSASYVRQRHAEIRKTLSFLDEYEMNKVSGQNKINEIDYYNKGRYETEQIRLF